MSKQQVHRFFETLDHQLDQAVQVILIGAGAASLLGSLRPSQDMDFEISLVHADPAGWGKVVQAVESTVEDTGIKANYGEEIGRWGMISLPDYRRHTFRYRRFGKVEVRLLDPPYWAIGKLDRYVGSDVQDLVAVLKGQESPWRSSVEVWGGALKQSQRSETLMLFRKHVEHFLRTHGRAIWGVKFDAEAAVRLFRRHAGIEME